jgi:alkylated DNA repair dioxygenase AlkB
LFEPDLPPGFAYRRDFITAAEEASFAGAIARIEFANFELRGVVARRRVAFFGRSYDNAGAPTPPLPEFLMPLLERAADWAQVDRQSFEMALVNEYRPGAPIGWHRDAPQYDIVVGVSLLSSCRMKFRPYVPPAAAMSIKAPRRTTHEAMLERRSAYLMAGDARNAFEHHIPPAASLRYSVTFRTLRRR